MINLMDMIYRAVLRVCHCQGVGRCKTEEIGKAFPGGLKSDEGKFSTRCSAQWTGQLKFTSSGNGFN